MGARTAMFLWNTVSAFQAFWSLSPHVFRLGTQKGLVSSSACVRLYLKLVLLYFSLGLWWNFPCIRSYLRSLDGFIQNLFGLLISCLIPLLAHC